MDRLAELYRPSLSLLTDLYQLTMAQGYYTLGLHEREACFHLFYRKPPFKGGYALAAGLAAAADWLQDLRFAEDDVAFLATLTGNDGAPLFGAEFLAWLRDTPFQCDIDAVPEGTVVGPHAPMVRVRGPLAQAQLVETALLTLINFSTLIATKSARICAAAAGDPVLEFGLRRAQGIDGGISASRAAYIGGCAATSNVLAGRRFGIPVKGTHAHSWVMVFEDEVASFEGYAAALPNNCVFLVDTYDTAQGVRHAVQVGAQLRARGHEMVGIRLDSGDLASLSIEARAILDAGGFPDAAIVASNDLDEYAITELKRRGSPIGVWGVGTRLATAFDQPALGGVYKLAAVRDEAGAWQPRIKLSNQAIKVSNPGVQSVRRYLRADGSIAGDLVYDALVGAGQGAALRDPGDGSLLLAPEPGWRAVELLEPIFRGGQRVWAPPPLSDVRDRAIAQVASLAPAQARGEAVLPVGLSDDLFATKAALMRAARGA